MGLRKTRRKPKLRKGPRTWVAGVGMALRTTGVGEAAGWRQSKDRGERLTGPGTTLPRRPCAGA